MQLTVQRENLQRALGMVERITSKNTSLPMLSNILLQTDRGRLTLTATNLEIGITADIGAKIDSEGRIAVPGRVLADLSRVTTSDTIIFSVKQNVLAVEAGKYKTSILAFDAAEYPIIPRITDAPVTTIPAGILSKLLVSIIDSVALTEARPELAGGYVRITPEHVIAAATDSFRLAEMIIPMQGTGSISCIIPRSTISELSRIVGEIEGDVAIRLNENQIMFSADGVELVSRLIDGRYPDYQKVIPEQSVSRVLVRRDELEHAIKAVAVFSSTISDMKLECRDASLIVSARNTSKGDGQTEIEANCKGDPFDITLNYRYLLDGVVSMPTEKIVIEFTGKGSPFVLRPNSDDRFVYLIMPLRN